MASQSEYRNGNLIWYRSTRTDRPLILDDASIPLITATDAARLDRGDRQRGQRPVFHGSWSVLALLITAWRIPRYDAMKVWSINPIVGTCDKHGLRRSHRQCAWSACTRYA